MRRRWLVWLACPWLLACEQTPSRGDRTAPIAVLTGRVRLAAGAVLPRYDAVDLAAPTLSPNPRRLAPSECAQANARALTPVELTAELALAGVIVAGSDFTRSRPIERKLHKVSIEHCRLEPALIAASVGDILELANHDAFAFDPLFAPSFHTRALGSGRSVRVPLVPGRFDTIACSRAAPCGRTDVAVFYHPVHTVTDARGNFRIDQFPANELVRVSAWHPLFEVSETFVWLEPGQHAAIELALQPHARFTQAGPAKADTR